MESWKLTKDEHDAILSKLQKLVEEEGWAGAIIDPRFVNGTRDSVKK